MTQSRNRFVWAFVALLVTLGSAPAFAQLSYDGFGYGPKPNLAGSNGGIGWTTAWTSGGSNVTSVALPGLGYTGLATTPGAAVTPPAGGVWPNSIYQRTFRPVPVGTTTLYVSFLMRADAGYGAWGGISFGTYPYKMSVGSPPGWYTYGLMVSEGLGDTSNKPLVQGETTLVVVKISKNASGPGVAYRMYLDPKIGTPEPSFADATFGIGPLLALPTAISIDNGTGFTTDEIRIGTTWGSVLPPAPNPWTDLGFAKPGVNGAPHLVGTGPLTAGATTEIALTNANPSSIATLVVGVNLLNAPFAGGTMVPDPVVLVAVPTDASGAVTLSSPWPSVMPAGLPIRFQYWIQDPAATFGLSASNGLQGVSQ